MNRQRTPIVMEEVTDPHQLAQARRQREQFNRNSAWLQAHIAEVYAQHRGKCVCVAGEELFVADTAKEAIARATAAHPRMTGGLPVIFPGTKSPEFMRFNGEWLQCDDSIIRPVMKAEIETNSGAGFRTCAVHCVSVREYRCAFAFVGRVGDRRFVLGWGCSQALELFLARD